MEVCLNFAFYACINFFLSFSLLSIAQFSNKSRIYKSNLRHYYFYETIFIYIHI